MQTLNFGFLCLAAVLLSNSKLVLALCPQGHFEVNGLCMQQTSACPSQFVLNNGACYPAIAGQCSVGSLSVNGRCCSGNCVSSCQTQSSCDCCTGTALSVPGQLVAPCPNQAVSPCPNQPAAPCPVQPVAPCPNQSATPCPAQPVAPCPTQPAPCPTQPVAPCPNQPVAPCPTQPAAPCPTQPAAPCPLQPAAPCPTQPAAPCPLQPAAPCPLQPVAPYPTQPVAPCPNQPAAPWPVQPYPTQPVAPCPMQPVAPYPIQPIVPYPVQPVTPAPTTSTTTSTPRPTYPTTSTTPLPPPAAIMRCPEGTILVNGSCRAIYCGRGVYQDKRCIQTECPAGTVWTGVQCAPPEPIVHSMTFNHTIITNFNRTEPDIIVNNVNNVIVNATIDIPISNQVELPQEEDCEEPRRPEAPITPVPKTPCCTVMTPRMCRPSSNGPRWNCYSRRYKRCGSFCKAPVIYLKPPRTYQTQSHVVMPPDPYVGQCRSSGTCPESRDFYDCSSCAAGLPERCSSYCYNYNCGARKCSFYDQRDYCHNSGGGNGCQEQDGCSEDWCSN